MIFTLDELEQRLHMWTQRLAAIAQTGLAFDPRVYDRERYEEILKLAAGMAATGANLKADGKLSDQLYTYWQAAVGSGVPGYVTPKVGVGAVFFNEHEEILLIQRQTGYWLYPTGWSDVGYSPAEVAVKEVREETGLEVKPEQLIAVYDVHNLSDMPEVSLHFYSILFYCELIGGKLNRHLTETLDAGFFPPNRMPQPLARPDLGWLQLALKAHRGELKQTYFDPA